MCSLCRSAWSFIRIEHAEQHCPLRNSQYCSYCASYGHLTKKCPAPPSKRFTEPIYVEQLVPPSELKERQITTLTPLPVVHKDEPQRLLEIEDNDRAIVAYLAAHSVKPVKGVTKRHLLEEYAKVNAMRVIYVPSAK